jgi:hypothetical protein
MVGRVAGVVVLSAVGPIVASSPALAESPVSTPPTFRAPIECGTQADFARTVEAKLGRPVALSTLATCPVDIRSDSAGFEASLEFATGERMIRGANCQDVVDAAALVVATAIVAAERDAVEATDPSPASRPSPWDGGVEGHMAADTGSVSEAGLAGGAALWVAVHGWQAEVGATVFLPRETRIAEAPQAGAEIGLWAATAAVCRRIWSLSLCGGGEAGVMSADGFGFHSSERTNVSWWAWTSSLKLPVRLNRHLAGLASLQAVLPHAPPRFVANVDNEETVVFEPSGLILRLQLGVQAKVF